MQSTKITNRVLNADALAKAVADMQAILAQMDTPSQENCGADDSDPDSSVDITDITSEPKGAAEKVTTTSTRHLPSANTTEVPLKEELKPGYVIFPQPILVNESEKRTYQVGTFDGKPVYHYWSRAEQFLSSFEYATPFGKRFLLDEPDSLLPPENPADTNRHPTPGIWWPGPGNSNKKFRFQRYYSIRPSTLGGFGAYAVQPLEKGQVILVERPLLLTTHAQVSDDVLALPPAALAIYKSLDGGKSPSWVNEIKNRNCFDLRHKIGFFAIASRFNHACRHASNVSYTFDHLRKVMVLAANKDVEAGTELTINYGAPSSACLYTMYGFVCRCGACRPLTRRDLELMGADLRECARWGLADKKEIEW
ncbi:hypothetical protein B0T21DRAFT_302069 [Apiosordaria backusii]|uniref:SET domain-containing protein n=1 Tax=Apiosordaria backusii TaxID=314023 RepID=A0AA40EYJ9_9PEZI|nr:hypothetical protein B0T21DRAFT_302069 [Apiosordaria backusii]